MNQLLIVSHQPSENTRLLTQALVEGAHNAQEEQTQLEVRVLTPLNTKADDLRHADALILLTTENFGYMSGAMKDMFDRCYYDIIDDSRGKPYCLIVRAGKDGTGTIRACESIIGGLGWKKAQDVTLFRGAFQEAFINESRTLAEGFATGLVTGIF
ncbi:MAG: NAD(P)H-dependent oxidoreductase [Agarilytica sp.]